MALGASVAINGVCLTATGIAHSTASFDVVEATRQCTNLGQLRGGEFVHVERSFRVGDEVGGHILSGHVATTCAIATMQVESNSRVSVAVPSPWRRYLMAKGFVALNGVSLTIADIDRERGVLTVNLIPETIARTTFGTAKVGDALNLEVDASTQAVVDTVYSLLPNLLRELVPGRE